MSTAVQFMERPSEPLNETTPDIERVPLKEHQTMKNESNDWIDQFRTLFESKIAVYKKGTQNPRDMFSKEEEDFLRSIGATPQEIFDFVEDWVDDGVPSPETALAITKMRRDYFIQEQQGQFPEKRKAENEFPSRNTALAGLEWFPRIIAKAQAKLRGELPSDLMYSCGADRRFLNKVNVTPVEFLQAVWEAGDDVDHIIKFVMERAQT